MTFSYAPQEREPRRGGAGQLQPQVPVNSEFAAPIENPHGLLASFQRRSSQAGAHGTLALQDRPMQTMNTQGAPPPEVVNGYVILYRRPNFFVRTVYRPGQRQPPLRKPSGYTAKTPTVIPHQEKRIAFSETRLMPRVTVQTTKQTRAIPMPAWLEAVMVVLALAGTCKEAYDHSVKRAEFRADDHNLQIVVDVFQVIHTIPPQIVYQAPAAGSSALAQADMTALPGGPSPGGRSFWAG